MSLLQRLPISTSFERGCASPSDKLHAVPSTRLHNLAGGRGTAAGIPVADILVVWCLVGDTQADVHLAAGVPVCALLREVGSPVGFQC